MPVTGFIASTLEGGKLIGDAFVEGGAAAEMLGWLTTGCLTVRVFLLRVRWAMGDGKFWLALSSSFSESNMARKGIMDILGAGLSGVLFLSIGPSKSAFAGFNCS